MSAFPFENIILHALPGAAGWEIFGVRTNQRHQEIIATLAAVVTDQEAERLANRLAQALAGKPYAEID